MMRNFQLSNQPSSLSRAGILFVVREVLPMASNWRYEKPGEREQILQMSLEAVLQYVTAVPEGEGVVQNQYLIAVHTPGTTAVPPGWGAEFLGVWGGGAYLLPDIPDFLPVRI
jgi:hypothetical protein